MLESPNPGDCVISILIREGGKKEITPDAGEDCAGQGRPAEVTGHDGTVQTETAAPASAIVIAVPSSGQNINWKESVSDQQGHFTLQGIAPGDYRLYAFGYTEMGAPEDPDLLKRLEGSSQKIRIDAHDRKVVSIRVITASALLE